MRQIQSMIKSGLVLVGLLGLTACGGGGGGGSTGGSSTPPPFQVACKDLQGCVQTSNGFQFPDGNGGTVTCANKTCTVSNANLTDAQNAHSSGYTSGYATGDAPSTTNYNNGYNTGYTDGQASGQTKANNAYGNGYNSGYASGQYDGNVNVNNAYNNGYNSGYSAGGNTNTSSSYNNGYNAGQANGFNDGYNSGYSAGDSDGYSVGSSDGYNDGSYDGYNSGYNDGYNSGYGDGYYDGYYGYSVIGGTKDTDLQKAQAQQASLEDRASAIAQNIGMSVDSARQMVQLSDQVRQMTLAGQMTTADRMAIANSALKIAGLSSEEVNTAISQAMKGNLKSANDLMEKAAKNMGMASSADLRDKLLPNVGLVMP